MTRAAALAMLLLGGEAGATGFTDIGQDITARTKTTVELHGALRVRGEALMNLDLDRGPTPSGRPLYPVPAGDPSAQTLTHADLRMRADLAMYAPGGGVAVKARFDVLDDPLGGDAIGDPAATTTQGDARIRVRRAWGEALLPVGLLAAGRMGAHWGLGMLVNGGDCADCDGGDASDRVAFLTPLGGLIWAVAYDVSASGPFAPRPAGSRSLDLDPSDDARTITFAALRWHDDAAIARRRDAGRATLDGGLTASYRWQENDVPSWYLPTAQPVPVDAGQVVARGYGATAFDLWLRLSLPGARIEAEGAVLLASIDQPSLIPGVELRDPVSSTQIGAALESELGDADAVFAGGLDAGYASGDPAPGFGAFPGPTDAAPQPGDLDGPQARPPGDNRVDNFRFHPDYRIDRILFREIIGTVTDAVYVRPHARFTAFANAAGTLTLSLAGVASWAVEPTSTPSGARGLGVELDPTAVYESKDGFLVSLEHAVLFPLAGLDGAMMPAKTAQLLRIRVGFAW